MLSASAHTPSTPVQATRPPMGELLELLRSNGLPVTTDDYVSLLKIVEYFGDEGLDSLGARICPIIATTPEEQERFYHVFETYKNAQRPAEPDVPLSIKWKKWLLALPVLLIVAAFIFIEENRQPANASIGLPPANRDTPRVALDEVYQQDLLQGGMFRGREADTAAVSLSWEDAGRGVIGQGLRLQHRFSEPGLHLIRRSLSSATLPVGRSSDTVAVYVCATLPRATISLPGDHVVVGQAVRISVTTDVGKQATRAYDWSIDAASGDRVMMHTDTPGLAHTFDAAGIYSITCTPVVTAADALCVQSALATLKVIDTGRQYDLTFTGGTEPVAIPSKLKWWPGLVLLLLASGISAWGFRKRRPQPVQGEEESPSGPAARRGPPYEVPFSISVVAEVILDKPLRRFVQQLRFQAEEEIAGLHVEKTICATIRAAGLTDLVFAPRKKAQAYLLFIDNRSPQGMLHHLFRFLGDVMEADSAPIVRFYYNQDFTCFNAEFPAGTTLRNIADNYSAGVPLILGDGSALMDRLAPVVRASLVREFDRWPVCLLITPIDAAYWGLRERILSAHFRISPADAADLERLGQQLRSSTVLHSTRKQLTSIAQQEMPEVGDIASLKAYLEGDEPIFQWLCAFCIYPRPRWELIVAIGKAILTPYGRLADLRYDMLLRLCRIPWLAEGSFPQRLRMELLKELSVPNEIAARAALLSLLAQVDKQYAGHYLFSAEMELQDTISRFVLYAHDPAVHGEYADSAEKFRKLFRAGRITDVPARKYLDKPEGDAWPTPLRQGEEPVSISRYFEVQEAEETRVATAGKRDAIRRRRIRQVAAAGGLVILTGIWSLLTFNQAVRSNPLVGRLYAIVPGQLVDLSYRVVKDFGACGDSSSGFRVLPATLSVNDQPYPLRFDEASQTLNASVPYQILQSSAVPPVIVLGTGGATSATISLDETSRRGTIKAICAVSDPVFASGTLPDALNELWQGKDNGRLMNIDLDRGFIYYSPGEPGVHDRYRIDTVITAGHIYKVVARAYPEYSVFFIANFKDGSFGLIACSQRYESLQDAIRAPEECGPYDVMRLYYDHSDTGKIFLPVPPPDLGFRPLVAEEKSKVLARLNRTKGDNSSIYYDQVNNASYIRIYNAYDFSKELSAYDMAAAGRAYRGSVRDEVRNPFQRSYLRLTFAASASAKNPSDPGLKLPDDLRQRSVNKDSLAKAAEAKAERDDRSRMTRATSLVNGGDLDGALKLYQSLQKSRNRSIAVEAAGRFKELLSRQSQQKAAEEEVAKQKAADEAVERQKRESEETQRVYDSIQKENVPRQKRPSQQQQKR